MAQLAFAPQARRLRIPPLRASTFELDPQFDSARIEWNRQRWHGQDLLTMARDRMVEENVRMLAGQHWGVWSSTLGRWVDIAYFMDQKERRWRQRPVINMVLQWYMLVKARMTENPPIVTFQPGNADRKSADLAAMMDGIWKALWHEAGMVEVIDDAMSWLIPGGGAYIKSRVNPNIGDLREFRGPAVLRLLDQDGQSIEQEGSPIERLADGVPFGPSNPRNPLGSEFVPQARLTGEGGEWEPTGKAFSMYEGGIEATALSVIECRGQWGNNVPWHRKRWHQHRAFFTPEEVFDVYGVEIEPEIFGEEAGRVGELRRMHLGTGHYGATEQDPSSFSTDFREGKEGLIEVLEGWDAPNPMIEGMGQDETNPGGRLLVTTRRHVLRDGARPAAFKYTSPIRYLSFVKVPGRPTGTTPQEAINPVNRTLNRFYAQVLEHGNLATNPIGLADKNQGIETDMITNEPAQILYIARDPSSSVPPLEYVQPPRLGEDVWRIIADLRATVKDLGNIEGAEGRPPTRDPSGELIKELRFNADRHVGPTLRNAVSVFARIAEDWAAILPTIWNEEKVLTWGGEDSLVRSITVTPDLFKAGTFRVVPDVESMLPEGRGERQQRAFALWQAGAFGPKDGPEAIRHYLEIARFPHMDRAMRPGGVDRITARQENARLLQGTPSDQILVLEWYDDVVHIQEHEAYMKTPEFLEQPVEIQQAFVIHRADHMGSMVRKFQQDLERKLFLGDETAQAESALGARQATEQLRLRKLAGSMDPRGHRPASTEAVAGGAPGSEAILSDRAPAALRQDGENLGAG